MVKDTTKTYIEEFQYILSCFFLFVLIILSYFCVKSEKARQLGRTFDLIIQVLEQNLLWQSRQQKKKTSSRNSSIECYLARRTHEGAFFVLVTPL